MNSQPNSLYTTRDASFLACKLPQWFSFQQQYLYFTEKISWIGYDGSVGDLVRFMFHIWFQKVATRVGRRDRLNRIFHTCNFKINTTGKRGRANALHRFISTQTDRGYIVYILWKNRTIPKFLKFVLEHGTFPIARSTG
jgi:hypothetical protein